MARVGPQRHGDGGRNRQIRNLTKATDAHLEYEIYSDLYPTICNVTQFIYFLKLLYMFRVISPPIIRSTYNCMYSVWYLSNRNCYLPLSWRSWNWN